MPDEVLFYLRPQPGDVAVDATTGLGGHAELLGKAIGPEGTLVGIDWDEELLERAKERLAGLECRKHFAHADFRQLAAELGKLGHLHAELILLDLGVCSGGQLDVAERGFSLALEGPLDMRMDRSSEESAESLIARLSEGEIERILVEYGEERWARAIAKQIVARRSEGKMRTTTDLVEAVRAAVPPSKRETRIHFATRTFQAVRCAVTGELEGLDVAVEDAIRCLSPSGRIVVIAYHSLEDRQVKRAFAKLSGKCVCPRGTLECRCGKTKMVRVLTSKPVRPTEAEVARNRRARSARLRAAERLGV
jgi:16S rRNA (cytosine1402-N4)-methyltransferase